MNRERYREATNKRDQHYRNAKELRNKARTHDINATRKKQHAQRLFETIATQREKVTRKQGDLSAAVQAQAVYNEKVKEEKKRKEINLMRQEHLELDEQSLKTKVEETNVKLEEGKQKLIKIKQELEQKEMKLNETRDKEKQAKQRRDMHSKDLSDAKNRLKDIKNTFERAQEKLEATKRRQQELVTSHSEVLAKMNDRKTKLNNLQNEKKKMEAYHEQYLHMENREEERKSLQQPRKNKK